MEQPKRWMFEAQYGFLANNRGPEAYLAMYECKNGYVSGPDYDALFAEHEKLRASHKRVVTMLGTYVRNDIQDQ
jgi:hypothetical protein